MHLAAVNWLEFPVRRGNSRKAVPMRTLPSSEDFARFEVLTGIHETVCPRCSKLLGFSKDVRGLEILEKAHQCAKRVFLAERKMSGPAVQRAA